MLNTDGSRGSKANAKLTDELPCIVHNRDMVERTFYEGMKSIFNMRWENDDPTASKKPRSNLDQNFHHMAEKEF